MNPEKLTQKSQEALREAQTLATRRGHQAVDVEHLLAALVAQTQGIVPAMLERAGVQPKAIAEAVDREIQRIPQVSGPGAGAGQVNATQRLAKVLDAPNTVLNSTSISRMLAKPETGVNENGSWYGAGLWVRQVTGHVNTWHDGSLPGTYTYTARLQNGFSYAALFNRREETGSPDFDVLSPLVNAEIGKVTSWPTTDLFPRYF